MALRNYVQWLFILYVTNENEVIEHVFGEIIFIGPSFCV